jgi:hypothetical protein
MRGGNGEGAYHLTGLAVECAVKACIGKNTKRHDFPPNQAAIKDIYTHDLSKLIGTAKLEKESRAIPDEAFRVVNEQIAGNFVEDVYVYSGAIDIQESENIPRGSPSAY